MTRVDTLIALGRDVHDAGMAWASSGNLSLRDGMTVYMTASGTRLARLSADDVVAVDLAGNVVEAAPDRRASKEANMHLAVYRQSQQAAVVLHASPPHVTYLSCTDLELPANAFPEGMMHLQDVARVPYHHAGSTDLAAAVEARCDATQVLVLENHGALTWGATPDDALLKLEVLEFAARLAVLGRTTGIQPSLVAPDEVRAFQTSGYRR